MQHKHIIGIMQPNFIECTLTKLTTEEIIPFFRKTTNFFPELANDDYAISYANKLAQFAEFVVCINDGEIIGMIAYYINTLPTVYITHVCVLPKYQQKGLFKQMLAMVEQESRLREFTTIKLEVRKDNEPAIRAYENSNFIYCADSLRGQYMEKKIIP